ncbi:hypothetical protein CVD19_20660 [Bacillus sp. T33-2]|nr:hypothetical protein CVD19_20660 [Bacillus sp. T33-2]
MLPAAETDTQPLAIVILAGNPISAGVFSATVWYSSFSCSGVSYGGLPGKCFVLKPSKPEAQLSLNIIPNRTVVAVKNLGNVQLGFSGKKQINALIPLEKALILCFFHSFLYSSIRTAVFSKVIRLGFLITPLQIKSFKE